MTFASGGQRNTMVELVLGGAKSAQINQMNAEDLFRSNPWGAGFSPITANFGAQGCPVTGAPDRTI